MSKGHLIFISHYSIIVLSKNTLPHIFLLLFWTEVIISFNP